MVLGRRLMLFLLPKNKIKKKFPSLHSNVPMSSESYYLIRLTEHHTQGVTGGVLSAPAPFLHTFQIADFLVYEWNLKVLYKFQKIELYCLQTGQRFELLFGIDYCQGMDIAFINQPPYILMYPISREISREHSRERFHEIQSVAQSLVSNRESTDANTRRTAADGSPPPARNYTTHTYFADSGNSDV